MYTEKVDLLSLMELFERHNGQLDETFSLFVNALCKKRGLSKQDLAQRLGIHVDYVTYLRIGLIHRDDVPEYLVRAIENELEYSYDRFVRIFCNQVKPEHSSEPQPQMHYIWNSTIPAC